MGVCSPWVYMVSSGCRSEENIHDEASSESSRDQVTVQRSAIYLGFVLGILNLVTVVTFL